MPPRFRVLVLSAGFVGLLSAAGVAAAQGGASPSPGPVAQKEAKLAWAKRRVELVCRPLEEQKMFDRATRCYNDVARLVGATPATADSSAGAPQPTARSAPAAAPAAQPKSAPSPRRAPVRTAAQPALIRVAATSIRSRPAPRPAAGTGVYAAPAAASGPGFNRCAQMSCMRYTLLGVGF